MRLYSGMNTSVNQICAGHEEAELQRLAGFLRLTADAGRRATDELIKSASERSAGSRALIRAASGEGAAGARADAGHRSSQAARDWRRRAGHCRGRWLPEAAAVTVSDIQVLAA
jgi:hypothetical protein